MTGEGTDFRSYASADVALDEAPTPYPELTDLGVRPRRWGLRPILNAHGSLVHRHDLDRSAATG